MIDNVKIGKRLGTGVYGTVYLCTYKGKKYAMKIQNLTGMMNEKTKYSTDIWIEIDVYRYISKMQPTDQVFFNRMYEYKVYNEIKKVGTNIGDSKHKWDKNIKNILDSGWRVKYLLEYKGNLTLYDFLLKNKSSLNHSHIYSLCLQILYIITLLKNGGYVHGDIHTRNIMVNKTKKPYFVFNNKKVKHYGIQLSVIDYGKSANKKFKIKHKGHYKYILTEEYTMRNLFSIFDHLLTNYHETLDFCNRTDKKRLWAKPDAGDNGLKKMFINHLSFCNKIVSKYLKIYPKASANMKIFYSLYKTNKNITGSLEEDIFYYEIIMSHLVREFEITYPTLNKKYFGWCRINGIMLPKEECIEIFAMTDIKSTTKWFLNKV